MNQESKTKLISIVFPIIITTLVVGIGIILLEYSGAFIDSGRTTDGLIVLNFGGILIITALLWWWNTVDIRLLRVEINEMKKL
jgi:hypothetical protein